jgi:hypothetical protein
MCGLSGVEGHVGVVNFVPAQGIGWGRSRRKRGVLSPDFGVSPVKWSTVRLRGVGHGGTDDEFDEEGEKLGKKDRRLVQY